MMNYCSSDSTSNNSDRNTENDFIHDSAPYFIQPRTVAEQHEEDYALGLEPTIEIKDEPYVYYPAMESLIHELDKRSRVDSLSSQDVVSGFSYVDTSFDDLAMAVEANSPDIIDGKPFGFESVFPPSPCKFRLRWTDEMDKLLLEAVKLYSDMGIGMWKKVAEYVQKHLKDPLCDEGGNVLTSKITNHQCGERYKHHLDPTIKQRKNGLWSAEEIDKLRELVNKYQTIDTGYTKSGRTKSQINWMKVSNELNRNYRDCQHKWATVSKASLKAGTFTQEEEDYIVRRVDELGSREPGIWNILESEMGRKARSIQDKYNRLTRKRKSLIEEDLPSLI